MMTYENGYNQALLDVDKTITHLFKFHNDGATLEDNLNVLNDTVLHLHQAIEAIELLHLHQAIETIVQH